MKCCLDLDGFLVMFHKPLCDLHMRPREFFQKWPEGDSNLESVFGMASEEIFSMCDSTWWAELPKSAICDSAISMAENVFEAKNVYLVTHPYDDRSHHGKVMWTKANLPQYMDRLIITKEKQLLANPHTVLFDDQDNNIRAFRDAGGMGVLVPQRWNSRYQRADFIWEVVARAFTLMNEIRRNLSL